MEITHLNTRQYQIEARRESNGTPFSQQNKMNLSCKGSPVKDVQGDGRWMSMVEPKS